MKYRVYLTNFGYYLAFEYDTCIEAMAAARRTGFECTIYRGRDLLCSWGWFSGWTHYRD